MNKDRIVEMCKNSSKQQKTKMNEISVKLQCQCHSVEISRILCQVAIFSVKPYAHKWYLCLSKNAIFPLLLGTFG